MKIMHCSILFLISSCLFYTAYCKYVETVPDYFFNKVLDEQNEYSIEPPKADNGGQPPFKYPFSFGHKAHFSGGWTRQVTVRDLPVSKQMAGVQMKLVKGGVREMHWHACAEWAYMIYGKARITGVDEHGRAFIDDVEQGDLWLFPGGIPHSIQGLAPEGAFFLLVFADGNFNEFETFLLSDWMRHIPRDVLAKNFQTNESTFANIPKEELYIFAADVPRSLKIEKEQVIKSTGEVPNQFSFHTAQISYTKNTTGGHVKVVDANNFKATNIAAAIVTLQPGGLRELHWHPNADEWQYYVKGEARMSVFIAGGQSRTMNFQAGDVGYIDRTVPHYVENIGKGELIFLEVFPTPNYQDISLAEWLAHTPSLLVHQHTNITEKFIESISKTEAVIKP